MAIIDAAHLQLLHLWEVIGAVYLAERTVIFLGVGVFIAIVVVLTTLILLAQAWLMPGGKVKIAIEDDRVLEAPAGKKLIQVLSEHGIFLPSACGGKGTCGECKAIIREGAGAPLSTEQSRLGRALIRQGYRLTCQVAVKHDLRLVVPPDLLGTHTWTGIVRSNRSLTPLIKELVLDIAQPPMHFKAGQYVLLEVPPHQMRFSDLAIDERFQDEWNRFDWWRHASMLAETTTRSYSMANAPDEGNLVMLNVRLALPPPNRPDIPTGKVSAYLFALEPGQPVKLSGAYGDFHVRERPCEMILIGGGAGMAPLRSMILDQLERVKTPRKLSYWYGARGVRELFYADLFEQLAQEHANFTWHVALSEPRPEESWEGPTGFIHEVLYEHYLKRHPAPEDCDYYLCGPPLMLKAVLALLDGLGVDEDRIFYDDFGG